MARERGYAVDIAGFEAALGRAAAAVAGRAQVEDASRRRVTNWGRVQEGWTKARRTRASMPAFVGYDTVEIETVVTAVKQLDDGRVAVLLRESPFYAESGGQVSDHGEIVGEGWRVDVDDVRRGRRTSVPRSDRSPGTIALSAATARVPSDRRRDTERNHTATHLLHAALRKCSASTCTRRARSWRPTGCDSTSRITAGQARAARGDRTVGERGDLVQRGRDDHREEVRRRRGAGRHGAVRREVRRRRARRGRAGPLDGAVRRHARAQPARSRCSRSCTRPAWPRACAASRR